MLKSTCPRCGKLIPYGATCPCAAQDKRDRNRRYDAIQRSKGSAAIYHSKAWQVTRAIAIARDNGLCLLCLEDKQITPCDMVHHIVEVGEDASRAYDIDNLVCLCDSCHARVHAEYNVNKQLTQGKLRKLLKKHG